METMKIPKLASVFVFLGCLVAYLTYVKRHADSGKAMFIKTPNHPSAACVSLEHQPCVEELTTSRFQYGVMFDAGSTGTRIHVFKFLLEENEAPKLAHEVFKAIKPGLSAYADEPDKCKDGVQELLGVAMETVPMALWKSTPVVLKATAGLRLLPGEKATHLLDKVRNVFSESPFLSRADSVSIMDGTDEGVSAWITVNFLIGSLHSAKKATVGMLDLGGGSTYTALTPSSPSSYLGLGLMSARLAVLGGIEGQPLDGSQELVSPCLAPQFMGQWEHAEVQYTVKGQKAGEPIYESCYTKVEKVLYKKVEKAEEVKDIDFYAFSYYYDRAVDIGTIDEKTGGTVKVSDYIDAAKKACNSMEVTPGQHPFLCLDLTYISVLLQQLGFPKDKVFKLARKINDVETSWALGATFHYLESLRRH
uniref:nucleoside diphosphate phosphatase n=2 Tax=Scleropages formosus TaxID=113540 RepID=A0A8C9VXZ6_SCLFO